MFRTNIHDETARPDPVQPGPARPDPTMTLFDVKLSHNLATALKLSYLIFIEISSLVLKS